MDILTDTRHPHRLEVVDTGRRRRWSDAAKLRVVEESFSEPRMASATARRHGISNQLMFAWRKAYREGRLGARSISGFVPAVVIPERPKAAASNGQLEIVTSNGRRVLVDCDVDADALVRIVRALETLA
ncbi:MAG: transposase [Aurantimonas endophytica]|uniref:IS66-like element accessory protein TnpA n=1 Tax=Aurantimonas endophytica TaxID=1522175 RepID=UPI003001B619